MRGGTKILVIITIIIVLISIGFSGCVKENGGDDNKRLDTDGDRILDSEDADDDNDGIPDEWESKYGLNKKNPNDKYNDFDNDGVDNKNEFDTGTDPTISHEFNKDMKENITKYGSPLFQTALFLFGKINETDFDDDGMPDSWEKVFLFNSTNPLDAELDFDLDGYTNKAEYDAKTDPQDPH